MEYSVKSGLPQKQRTPCLVLGVFDAKRQPESTQAFNKATNNSISNILRRGDFNGKLGDSLILYDVQEAACERILLIGCGKEKNLDFTQFQKIIDACANQLKSVNTPECVCYLSLLPVKSATPYQKVRMLIEGIDQKQTKKVAFKQGKNDSNWKLKRLICAISDRGALKNTNAALEHAQAINRACQNMRYLGDTPPNMMSPAVIAENAKKLASIPNVTVNIIGETELKNKGMGGILAVGQGSPQESHLITVNYQGSDPSQAPIVLVGKGVAYDSGGIALKPWRTMHHMKMDMLGAASVISVLQAVAELQLPVNLISIVPTVENAIGSKAYRPGDVITTYSGKTIEVLNTDAEGRIILCDALTYAQEFNPKAIIDVATLTGAIVIALGQHHTGLFSNHQPLANQLIKCGEQSFDRCWQLPIGPEYNEMLDSDIADMKNIGGRDAGSITAACFLQRFIAPSIPWAHLDIAGTAMLAGHTNCSSVKLLFQYILSQVETSS